jgi:hypothetical protein
VTAEGVGIKVKADILLLLPPDLEPFPEGEGVGNTAGSHKLTILGSWLLPRSCAAGKI